MSSKPQVDNSFSLSINPPNPSGISCQHDNAIEWDASLHRVRALFAQRAPTKVVFDSITCDIRWPKSAFQVFLVEEIFRPFTTAPITASSAWLNHLLKLLQADVESQCELTRLRLSSSKDEMKKKQTLEEQVISNGNGKDETVDTLVEDEDEEEVEVSDALMELLIYNQGRLSERDKEENVQTFFPDVLPSFGHSNNRYIDFDCIDEPFKLVDMDPLTAAVVDDGYLYLQGKCRRPVSLRTLRTHNQVGTRIWEAGLFLAEVFASIDPRCLLHRHVFELGAGVGVTGLMLRSLHPGAVVTMSDYSKDVVANLEYNVRMNRKLSILAEKNEAKRAGLDGGEGGDGDVGDVGDDDDDDSSSESVAAVVIDPDLQIACSSTTISSEQCFYMTPDGRSRVEVFDWFYPTRDISPPPPQLPHTSPSSSSAGAAGAVGHSSNPRLTDPCLPIDLLIAADCTYSMDMNPHLAKVIMGRLPTTAAFISEDSSSSCSSSDSSGSNSSSFKYLVALVACTVRNEETFSHFLQCLDEEKARRNCNNNNNNNNCRTSDISRVTSIGGDVGIVVHESAAAPAAATVVVWEWDYIRIREQDLRVHIGPGHLYYPNKDRIELIKVFVKRAPGNMG